MKEWFADLAAQFKLNFINGNRWRWLLEGFKTTLIITFFATILGIVIGVVVATVRSTYDKTYESLKKRGGFAPKLFGVVDKICKIYLSQRNTISKHIINIFYF